MINLGDRVPLETLGLIEDLRVEPDFPAIVIIDEASGTIVMGANVRISTVAIAQGNLTIRVTETPEVSQPGPCSATTRPRSCRGPRSRSTTSRDKRLGVLSSGVTLRDLVGGLNALGVSPRDMISILEAIKAAGALQADLESDERDLDTRVWRFRLRRGPPTPPAPPCGRSRRPG